MGSIIDNQLRLTFRILCLKIDVALEKVLSRYCTMTVGRILSGDEAEIHEGFSHLREYPASYKSFEIFSAVRYAPSLSVCT